MRLAEYRASDREILRTEDLLRALPKGRQSVLDIGARDGHFSKLLAARFREVTALDLRKPSFEFPGVTTVAGDITKLQFPDDSFDCVFCAEVLEHIPDVNKACRELIRVAKHEVIIGVPFQQDIRVGRTLCSHCGKINPPWGHVNSFSAERLRKLFSGLHVVSESFVGKNHQFTNPVSAFLMNLAGNPWGTYNQEEGCIHCGSTLVAPTNRSLARKACSALAVRLDRFQARFSSPHGNWIHIVFQKPARIEASAPAASPQGSIARAAHA